MDVAFGAEFLDNENTQIIRVDSFGVTLSTVYVDSFITSGKNVALVGGYKDPFTGTIAASSYMQVALANYQDVFQNTSYDSLILIAKPNKYYYGDSTKPIQINISRLAETIEPPNGGTVLYNVNSFSTLPILLGSKTIQIRPLAQDSFVIRLSDALGQEFLSMLQRKSDTMKINTVFLDYFKGLLISSPTNNAMIFGFSDSVKLRLCYKQQGLYLENKTVDFTISNNNLQFNSIKVDRAGTALQNIGPTNKEINSIATNNVSFSQYFSSVVAKLRFPSIKEILKFSNYKKILKAQLIIKPALNSYSFVYALPTQLRLARTTQLNLIGNDITYVTTGGNAATQTGSLVVDYLYGKGTYYTYDVTSYMNEVIATDGFTQNGLLVLPPSPDAETTLNKVVIANQNNPEQKMQLQIYYVTVQ